MDTVLKNNGYSWNDFIRLFTEEESLLLSITKEDCPKLYKYINNNFSDIYIELIQIDKNTYALLRYKNFSVDDAKCIMLLSQGEEYYRNKNFEQSLTCFHKLNSLQYRPNIYTYIMMLLASKKSKKHQNAVNYQKIIEIIIKSSYLSQEKAYLELNETNICIMQDIFKDINKCFASKEQFSNILDAFCLERQKILTRPRSKKSYVYTKKNFTWE